MKNESKIIDEQAFDALLSETVGGFNPPDLSGVVMERLESGRETLVDQDAVAGFSIETIARTDRSGKRFVRHLRRLGVLAAVAASLLWFLARNPSNNEAVIDSQVAIDPPSPELIEVVESVPKKPQQSHGNKSNPKRPLRGIPMLVEAGSDTKGRNSNEANGVPVPEDAVLAEVNLVSSKLNQELMEYWESVGVTPTGEVPLPEAADRLFSRLDLKIPSEMLLDPETMQTYLAQTPSAKQLATAWLRQMTNGGLGRLEEDDLVSLVNELAKCIEGERSLDRTLLSWIEGQNPRSAAFHQAFGSVGRVSTVNHLAKLTMNVDLRCIRCHDSKIEGTGRQADYWGFAALLKSSFTTQSVSEIPDANQSQSAKPIFYELLDGRQRIADPSVSSRWLATSDGQPVRSVKEWADALSGSRSLANGVVNSLWELVYGMPLEGRVVDPVTAPHDAVLDGIQDRLVSDLMESDFNISRSLALIIGTPVARRAVPEALNDDGQVVASSRSRAEAIHAINAFAASLPIKKRLSVKRRVDQVTRSMGTTLNSGNPAFVAQADNSTGKPPKANRNTTATFLDDDFPTASDTLPVQWLRLIQSQDSRVDHLAYLADLYELPKEVADVVQMMDKETVEDQNLLLQRVWWMLRP
ncbi:MAG: hypothetical protein L7U72_14035 [Rubripirellula sp.]|nr:hypothetical protein [Rubripirellula sp.]